MHRYFTPLGVLLLISASGHVASAAPILAVDINSRSGGEAGTAANTVAGYEAWTINAASGAVASASRTLTSGYTVAIDIYDDGNPDDGSTGGVDNAGLFDDRDRIVPTSSPNLNQLYDDFIFAGGTAGPSGGLDVRISGGALLPSTQYFVSLFAYDGISASMGTATPVRAANWFDGNTDTFMTLATFTVNEPPTTDDQYKFTGLAMTDASGGLFLKGRRITVDDVAVYLNGLEIAAVPEPGAVMMVALGGMAVCARRRRR